MKHDVFISHAHEDKSIADAICGKLESAHLKCWTAARDIPAREDWTEATRKAIGSSRVIVLVLTTFLCAVVLFLWFALRQMKEWASLAESHRRSVDRGFGLSPTPSPQAGGDSLASKQTSTVTPFGLWHAANGSPTPMVQGPQDPPLNTPAERSANATSSPQRDVTPGERAGGLVSEPRPRHLPPVTHRVSHDHHQQYPGTQVKEARKIADLENQRDSLQSQLKDAEANVVAIQKNADLVTSQRDELQTRLNESEEKTQIAEKNAAIVARELDELRNQLKETENRALTAQKNAELATRQRDALQSEMGKLRERAQLAETKANLAASQRDTVEAELKKKEEEEAQKKAQANQHGADLAELPNSAPDTQFQEVRKDARPAHEDAEFAQTQPPNPGQNAKPAPLTQTLESTGPSRN